MKTSVVITTYNGEKYILEQLKSIKNQTKEPDEVIIRDDQSKDNTINIIEEFIKKNNLPNWKLIVNSTNLGWKLNFKKGLQLATGDLIFLSDQDDIWLNNKVEEACKIFENNTSIEIMASNYYILNDNTQEITLRDKSKKDIQQTIVKSKFFHTNYPGAVYTFRKEYLEEVLNYWDDKLAHDAQLFLIGKIKGTAYISNKPLIYYRRHNNNVTGHDPLSLEIKLNNLDTEERQLKIAAKYTHYNKLDYLNPVYLKRANSYLEKRKSLLKNKKLVNIFRLLPYINYYIFPKTYFGDIYVSFQQKK